MQQAGHKNYGTADIGSIKHRRLEQYPPYAGIGNDPGLQAVIELVQQPFFQLQLIGYIAVNIDGGLIDKGFTGLKFSGDRAGSN